ncbi:peroxiredoxin prx1 [Anaeramoeba ignava]|uniref:Peroxiredoxin prx1 n=1 Tax=Anaeramoeba ignava TaxID=1746090 RepID=A0A9Q0L8N3_ANAIG|nr:peroxiredoxin prx1 [Anaeramoeba ignava]|eukprot:Anaeramoba_ignava/a223214_810.p1 GENE.a223214_810~~a223214_810.p1  ORF type:complete len:257 (-),score=85.64 a223214_810:25-738(-)
MADHDSLLKEICDLKKKLDEINAMPLIGDKSPEFEAETTMGPIKFPQHFSGKWVILFSHPGDFTPVCTTEFMTFATMHKDFQKLNCELIGLSIDSNFSHIAWVRTIEEKIKYKDMEKVQITFPVIADSDMNVAKKFGMLHQSTSKTQTVRAVFIIDPQAIIRAIIYYPLSNGRNMDEIMRLLVAMQTSDKNKVATPANWKPGEDVIVPPPNTVEMAEVRTHQKSVDAKDWFFATKKI